MNKSHVQSLYHLCILLPLYCCYCNEEFSSNFSKNSHWSLSELLNVMLTAQTAGLQFLHQSLTGGVHTANENFFNKTPDCSFNHSFLGSEKVSCKTSKDSERKILQRYFDFGPTTSKAAAAGSVWGAEPEPSAAGSCTWSRKKNKIPKYPTCNYDWLVWRERVSPSAARRRILNRSIWRNVSLLVLCPNLSVHLTGF